MNNYDYQSGKKKELSVLTESEFDIWSELIYSKARIRMEPHKRILVSNRLRRRLDALSLSTFEEYYKLLQMSSEAGDEWTRFLEVITTNETYFNREAVDFDILKKIILPDLQNTYPDKKIQVLSAGCSTGEETYDLAMHIQDYKTKLQGIQSKLEFSIDAIDISNGVIRHASRGIYVNKDLEKLNEKFVRNYFEPVADMEDHFQVVSELRNKISFSNGNLFQVDLQKYHLIFCRNVMIYFTPEDRKLLVDRFYQALFPGGYLIVGGSESLTGIDSRYTTLRHERRAFYKK